MFHTVLCCVVDIIHHCTSDMSRIILLLAVCCSGLLARPERGHRRSDLKAIKQRLSELPRTQEGECPPLWTDASSVGLGCILIDINDMGTDEVSADTLCRSFEGGRLLEIYTADQMSFLQTLLAEKEEQLGIMDGFIWYWLGLNDIAEEGQWVWPSGAAAEFTYWDTEYEEPYPGQ